MSNYNMPSQIKLPRRLNSFKESSTILHLWVYYQQEPIRFLSIWRIIRMGYWLYSNIIFSIRNKFGFAPVGNIRIMLIFFQINDL